MRTYKEIVKNYILILFDLPKYVSFMKNISKNINYLYEFPLKECYYVDSKYHKINTKEIITHNVELSHLIKCRNMT